MKKFSILASTLLFLFSCDSDEELMFSDIIGTWRLTETLVDPGDGSGTFEPIESDKMVSFTADGEMSSNGNFCNSPVINGSGIYSLSDSTITVECSQTITLHFDLTSESLIIFKHCIEPCAEKYVKTN